MRRLVSVVAVALVSALTLTACGSDDSTSGGSADPVKKISITFNGEDTDPSGQKIDVSVGQRIEFDVTADAAGEIHVHSSPEQEFEYDKGSTTLSVDPVERPGQVTVESHTLDKVLFTLVAR
jgi:hypothetical protein